MSLLTIYDVNQPCLRAKCAKVTRITPAQQRLFDDMIETMRAANGVGLAAPQVGVVERLVVIELEEDLYALVNPEVVESSDDIDTQTEGCLSLPNYFGPVDRPSRVVVKAMDRKGKKLRIKADGWLARVLQHEIDHLDGVLFFDRMRSLSDLKYEPPDAPKEDDGSGGGSEEAEPPASQGTRIAAVSEARPDPAPPRKIAGAAAGEAIRRGAGSPRSSERRAGIGASGASAGRRERS